MLNNENSIEVRNVSKSFKVYFDKGNELKEKMLFWKRNRYENRVLLNDISSLTGFCSSLSPFKLNSLGIVKQCAHPFSSVGYAISGNPIQPTNIYLPSGAFVVCGA